MRVDPWARDLASPEHPERYLTAEESENGTDLVQLRARLRMTPEQRLQVASAATRAGGRLMDSAHDEATRAAARKLRELYRRQPRNVPNPPER